MLDGITSAEAAKRRYATIAATVAIALAQSLAQKGTILRASAQSLRPEAASAFAHRPAKTNAALKPKAASPHAINPKKEIKPLSADAQAVLKDLGSANDKTAKAAMQQLRNAGFNREECMKLYVQAQMLRKLNLVITGKTPISALLQTGANADQAQPVDFTAEQLKSLTERGIDPDVINSSDKRMLRSNADLDLEAQKNNALADLAAIEAKPAPKLGVVGNANRAHTQALLNKAAELFADLDIRPDGAVRLEEPKLDMYVKKALPAEEQKVSSPHTDANFTATPQPMNYEMGLNHTPASTSLQKPAMSLEQQVTLGMAPPWILPPKPKFDERS